MFAHLNTCPTCNCQRAHQINCPDTYVLGYAPVTISSAPDHDAYCGCYTCK